MILTPQTEDPEIRTDLPIFSLFISVFCLNFKTSYSDLNKFGVHCVFVANILAPGYLEHLFFPSPILPNKSQSLIKQNSRSQQNINSAW